MTGGAQLPGPQIAGRIARRFGLGEPVGPLTPIGKRPGQRTWRLDTFGGRYFVKEYLRPRDLPGWSVWQRSLHGSWEVERAAVSAGLPVAIPVLAPGSCVPWVDFDVAGEPVTFRVHEWVDGVARVDPPDEAVAAQLGTVLGRVHRLLPPLRSWRRRPDCPTDWRSPVTVEATGSWWYPAYRASLPLLEELSLRSAGALVDNDYLVRTHRDLHAHNVLIETSGRAVVVDWDAAATLRADWDLVETAMELAGTLSAPPSRTIVEVVVAAYRSAGGRSGPITPASFTGLTLCVLGWVRSALWAASAEPRSSVDPEATTVDQAGRELVRTLGVVGRIAEGAETWGGWFA